MIINGRNKRGNFVEEMNEVVFNCSKEEVDCLLEFFTKVRKQLCEDAIPEEAGFVPIGDSYCMEMFEWVPQWSGKNPGVIVYVAK